jgi:transcription elongation factor Elf1
MNSRALIPATKPPMKKPRRLARSATQEAAYTCDSCGEEIVVPVDLSAGSHQAYVEDCPVCCHPMSLRVELGPGGEAHVHGQHE